MDNQSTVESRKEECHMKKSKIIAFLLIICFSIGTVRYAERVWATTAHDRKEDAENKLDDANKEIDKIEDQQGQVQDEIKDARKKLTDLIAKQDLLEKDINNTQGQIETTQKELEQAEKEAQEQYEDMKLRIQFMYENSAETSLLVAILEADGLADLLNRVEYVSAVHKADRELTKQYQETVKQVEEKKLVLEEQMGTLLAKQEAFIGQQAEVESLMADLKEEEAEFASALAVAKKKAKSYEAEIKRQEEIIRKQQEEANKKPGGSVGNGTATGQEIVDYALRFVGNPYVWGGNSLTNGCDCSGFVHLVYQHFGYRVPRYSMSFLNVGTPVALDDIRPGDIVIYNKHKGIGHVAIYIGNGKIVEAQSTKAGITSNRRVDCRTIAGIRRVAK